MENQTKPEVAPKRAPRKAKVAPEAPQVVVTDSNESASPVNTNRKVEPKETRKLPNGVTIETY